MLVVTKLIHRAAFPNVNAGIRKSFRSRSGKRARRSHQMNKARKTTPPKKLKTENKPSQGPFLCRGKRKKKKRDTEREGDRPRKNERLSPHRRALKPSRRQQITDNTQPNRRKHRR